MAKLSKASFLMESPSQTFLPRTVEVRGEEMSRQPDLNLVLFQSLLEISFKIKFGSIIEQLYLNIIVMA